jgi:hypothetical protein
MHGVSTEKEMVVHGGHEDVPIVRTHKMPFPVFDSPTQRVAQSGMSRRDGAGNQIEPNEGPYPSGVLYDHYVGMFGHIF